MNDELHNVYKQLNDLIGTSVAIKDLLREIQDRGPTQKSEINIGNNKEDSLRNLRLAVQRGYAQAEEVQQLLWNLEETGKQHILLLQPAPEELASPTAPVNDRVEVSVALFDDMPIADLFPRYEYPSSGYIWSDFRHEDASGWIAKAYGRETFRESQGIVSTEELDDGTEQETRQYKWKEVRSTLVTKWRPQPGILELRIDNSNLQSKKTIDDRLAELWKLLRPAFQKSDLIGLDVDNLLHDVVYERQSSRNQNCFSISRVELTDPRSGQIRVIPNSSDALDNDPGRKASLETMQKNAFLPSLARIEWKVGLPGCPPCMTEPVSVVLEKTSNGPELRILKRITNHTYEYIFDQLRSRL